MLLCPLNGLADSEAVLLIQSIARKFGKLAQGNAFSVAQLRFPQRQQFRPAQIFLLPASCCRGELSAQGLEFCTSKLRFFRKQFGESLVNLRVPFGKPLTQLFRGAFNFKITSHAIMNPVTEAPQFASEFVVIGVLGKLSSAQ